MLSACWRERANLQLANRRLERKVKDMMMQGEEEHNSLLDQKDQVCDYSQFRCLWTREWFLSLTFYNLGCWFPWSWICAWRPWNVRWTKRRRRSTDWSTPRRSCRESWMSSRRRTSSCRTSSKVCRRRSGEWPKQERKVGWKTVCVRALTSSLCGPGVRARLPRCSTPCTMTKTTTTSAPMGRHISAHRRPISARLVRRTSSPPSLCEVRNETAALTLQARQFMQYYYSQALNWSAPYSLGHFIQTNVYIVYFDKSTFLYLVSRSALDGDPH